MAQIFPTSATKTGAIAVSRINRVFAQDDVGSKLEKLISTVNALNTAYSAVAAQVSLITSALAYMQACSTSWGSALSATGISSNMASNTSLTVVSLGTISNFRA